jgi:tetratricopeptide (TPR) repeat protein
MTDRLRPLWNFGDLDATEERLREQLSREASDGGRAEVLAELARVEGLRGDFAAGETLVARAEVLAGDSAIAAARIELERGRLLRSSGDDAAALPRFESAYDRALQAGDPFVAADAAHMAALVDERGARAWTERGIELAEQHDDASYWLGPLLNNLGWELFEAGEHDGALEAFEQALAARERDPENRAAIEIARYAVGKTLRALGRADQAIPLLEGAVAWAEHTGEPDGWFHEELAEDYAAVGRLADAGRQAQLALPLLLDADPSFTPDGERETRLRALADA